MPIFHPLVTTYTFLPDLCSSSWGIPSSKYWLRSLKLALEDRSYRRCAIEREVRYDTRFSFMRGNFLLPCERFYLSLYLPS